MIVALLTMESVSSGARSDVVGWIECCCEQDSTMVMMDSSLQCQCQANTNQAECRHW